MKMIVPTGMADWQTSEVLETSEVLPNLVGGPLAAQAGALIEERLRAGGEVRFTITSTSMWPALCRGDEVTVRGAGLDEVRPGDILFRQAGETWLAHRLIERRGADLEAQLITKGDNSPRADPAWPPERLRGVVVAVRGDRLDTRPGRLHGALLAGLSRAQVALWRPGAGVIRQAAVKGIGLALRAGVALGRRNFGWTW